jgi:drug/metabolite transporter superfamily protein YnfA
MALMRMAAAEAVGTALLLAIIVLSLIWGWLMDGDAPDRFDLVGGSISLIGVFLMMYWPR